MKDLLPSKRPHRVGIYSSIGFNDPCIIREIMKDLKKGCDVTLYNDNAKHPWRNCPDLPEGVEVIRANGLLKCHHCYKLLYDHPKYRYKWGTGLEDATAVKGCDGRFYHL